MGRHGGADPRPLQTVLDVKLPEPFPAHDLRGGDERFGIDRPDLRIPLELVEVGDLMQGVEFKVFAEPAADPDGRVAALRLPGGEHASRKEIDDYTAFVGALRREGPRLHQGERPREGPRRPAVADPEVPAGCDGRGPGHSGCT